MPGKSTSARRMKCCVMVFDGRQMVLVSAEANLEPLFKYALDQPALRAKARLPETVEKRAAEGPRAAWPQSKQHVLSSISGSVKSVVNNSP